MNKAPSPHGAVEMNMWNDMLGLKPTLPFTRINQPFLSDLSSKYRNLERGKKREFNIKQGVFKDVNGCPVKVWPGM